jgi:hypothetical protein
MFKKDEERLRQIKRISNAKSKEVKKAKVTLAKDLGAKGRLRDMSDARIIKAIKKAGKTTTAEELGWDISRNKKKK